MKAVIRTRYGSPDVLELQDVDKPVPKDNQVLVKVCAAGVNALDWHVLRGDPFLVRFMGFGLFKPKHRILGADVSGYIEAVGKHVTGFKEGDGVFATGMGGFAEYVCLREDHVATKPPNVSFEQAAAVPVAALTALQALRDHGKVQSRDHVLVNGASGGVGTFAVQLAKSFGAQVTGVCSGRNADLVRSIGADQVIDYTKEHFWENGVQYDLIVDNAAFHSVGKALRGVKPNGRYVLVGGSSSLLSILKGMLFTSLVAKAKGRKLISFIANLNQADLTVLKDLLETGKVTPVIDKRYSLSETAEAIRYIEKGHAAGKVVMIVDPK